MDSNSTMKDWLFRYNHLMNKRSTKKQKDRFINSLIADIYGTREDINVTEIQFDERDDADARNIYVGDVKKASTIITTYYDTPTSYLGSYAFFDVAKRRLQTLRLNVINSVIIFIIGILYTIYIAMPLLDQQSGFSWVTVLIVVIYLIFFVSIRKAANGIPKRKTLVRNTSSVVLILDLITQIKSKKVAFAFIDRGTQNELGLQALRKSAKSTSRIYHLDSVGSNHSLYAIGNIPNDLPDTIETLEVDETLDSLLLMDDRITTFISAEIKDGYPVLSKDSQHIDEVNLNNINIVKEYLKRK